MTTGGRFDTEPPRPCPQCGSPLCYHHDARPTEILIWGTRRTGMSVGAATEALRLATSHPVSGNRLSRRVAAARVRRFR